MLDVSLWNYDKNVPIFMYTYIYIYTYEQTSTCICITLMWPLRPTFLRRIISYLSAVPAHSKTFLRQLTKIWWRPQQFTRILQKRKTRVFADIQRSRHRDSHGIGWFQHDMDILKSSFWLTAKCKPCTNYLNICRQLCSTGHAPTTVLEHYINIQEERHAAYSLHFRAAFKHGGGQTGRKPNQSVGRKQSNIALWGNFKFQMRALTCLDVVEVQHFLWHGALCR